MAHGTVTSHTRLSRPRGHAWCMIMHGSEISRHDGDTCSSSFCRFGLTMRPRWEPSNERLRRTVRTTSDDHTEQHTTYVKNHSQILICLRSIRSIPRKSTGVVQATSAPTRPHRARRVAATSICATQHRLVGFVCPRTPALRGRGSWRICWISSTTC